MKTTTTRFEDGRTGQRARKAALALTALFVLPALLGLSAAAAHAAPTARLRVSRGPYYVGVPVELHVEATGLARDPEPECRVDTPASGKLQLVGLSPSVSTSMQIVGGRVTRSESVTFLCQFRYTPASQGRHTLGPFRVVQDRLTAEVGVQTLDVVAVPLDPKLRVRIVLPEEPVYIGQRVPVRIEWWLEESLQDRVADYVLQSDLFEREDVFRFLPDERPVRGQQTLELQTAQGELPLAAEIRRERSDGTDFLVVSAERTLVPLRSGRFDLPAASIQVEEVVRWRRDLFGTRRPAATRRILSRDQGRRLEVRPAPAAGRPESFAGAIGRGFSLAVAADRSVVQVGDPITLTVTVRGDGNLAAVGLPDWGSSGALPADRLRLSEGDVSGEVQGDSKVFRLDVRVLDDAVREIPALDFSWFDPELEAYQTTQSRPIAVSVRPAQVIGADDVVSGGERSAAASAAEREAPAPDAPAERRGSLSLTGADLSIVTDPDALVRGRAAAGWLPATAYGLSLAVVAGALVVRRRLDVSPELARRRRLVARARARVDGASRAPAPQALEELAIALRELAAGAPEHVDAELSTFLRECDEILYSPDAARAAGDLAAWTARARGVIDAVKERIG